MSHQLKAVVLLLVLHIVACTPENDTDRPVHEVVNEQERSDDTRPFLPYSNPLAGKSLQNAKLHAENQQAMFNAERIRKHRAQTQRWNQGPTKADTYIKAYHDLQENHQLELEKEQSTIQEKDLMSPIPPPVKQDTPEQKSDSDLNKRIVDRGLRKHRNQKLRESKEENKLTSPTPPPPPSVRQQSQNPTRRTEENKLTSITPPPQPSIRQQSQKPTRRAPSRRRENTNQRQNPKNTHKQENLKEKQGPDVTKFVYEDAKINRNHRSFGSLETLKYNTNRYGNIKISPAPTYDQGVHIKPNGNLGFPNTYEGDTSKLFTEAIPSKTHFIYPKQFSPEFSQYASNNQYGQHLNTQNIEALQTLLQKRPQEQVSGFNAIVENQSIESKELLDKPLYYYLENQQPAKNYAQIYASNVLNYANANEIRATSEEFKDHRPVNEILEDVPLTQDQRITYVLPTQSTDVNQHTNQPQVTNHYKHDQIQTYIATSPTPEVIPEHHHKLKYYNTDISAEIPNKVVHYSQEYKPEVNYEPAVQYLEKNHYGEGNHASYHNEKHQPIRHLSQDGDGVSAYEDDEKHYAANYEYGYRVMDAQAGNDFGHFENKTGPQTDGNYHVLLPDGRMQLVKYTAGPSGFHADISYDHVH